MPEILKRDPWHFSVRLLPERPEPGQVLPCSLSGVRGDGDIFMKFSFFPSRFMLPTSAEYRIIIK